jgi:hypothetical protein
MADIKIAYDTAQNFTFNIASLANNALRMSSVVDNTTNKYVDAFVQVSVTLGTGTPVDPKSYRLYIYGGLVNNLFPDRLTGTDATVTYLAPFNYIIITDAIIFTPSSGGLVWSTNPFTVARWFGGRMPPFWGIGIRNVSGVAFAAAGHSAKYMGIWSTST